MILNPAGYMLASSGFAFIHLRYIFPYIPLKWSVILLKSRTSTTYFSYSTGSSVTNRRFFHNPTVAQLNTICSKNDHYTIITIIVYYYLELRSAVTI